jgi:hypothetical protein
MNSRLTSGVDRFNPVPRHHCFQSLEANPEKSFNPLASFCLPSASDCARTTESSAGFVFGGVQEAPQEFV